MCVEGVVSLEFFLFDECWKFSVQIVCFLNVLCNFG